MSAVKFRKFYVTDGANKARITYSLDNNINGKRVVTLYEKDYKGNLGKIFPKAFTNASEYQSDYVCRDIVRIFEDSPFYAEARTVAVAKLQPQATA